MHTYSTLLQLDTDKICLNIAIIGFIRLHIKCWIIDVPLYSTNSIFLFRGGHLLDPFGGMNVEWQVHGPIRPVAALLEQW